MSLQEGENLGIISQAMGAGVEGIQFDLIDTISNLVIKANLQDGDSVLIDEDLLAQKKLTLSARIVNPTLRAQSVEVALGRLRKVDAESPYSLFGDSEGDYRGGALPLGSVSVRATAFAKSGAKGDKLAIRQIAIRLRTAGVNNEAVDPSPEEPSDPVQSELLAFGISLGNVDGDD